MMFTFLFAIKVPSAMNVCCYFPIRTSESVSGLVFSLMKYVPFEIAGALVSLNLMWHYYNLFFTKWENGSESLTFTFRETKIVHSILIYIHFIFIVIRQLNCGQINSKPNTRTHEHTRTHTHNGRFVVCRFGLVVMCEFLVC